MTGYHVHRASWTAAESRRFWDHFAARPRAEESYFSRRVGGAVLDYACSCGVDPVARMLDFGCGPGHLLERMERRGWRWIGIDFSEVSVRQARERMGRAAAEDRIVLADVLPTRLAAGSCDALFLLETVEHLADGALTEILGEAHRLLAPAGRLVLTTPNREELTRSEALCPECGCLFHTMQHVRSWSAESLRDVVERAGFDVERCQAVAWMGRLWMTRLATLAYRCARREPPNLVLVATRPPGGRQSGSST